ncbi:A disintegrin and metalloproteinase with thrombospondin motifs 17-like isoform X2 [Oryzias latipes]
MLDSLYEWFWWDKIWLPAELSWADLEDKEGRVYAKASHLYITLPYACGLLLIRYLFERMVAAPLAAFAGIRQRACLRPEANPALELYYTTCNRNPLQADMHGLSKKSGLSMRQVERWFRRRRVQDHPGVLKKFKESSWRFAFYLFAFVGGLAALHDKEWLYDSRQVWTGYPQQSLLESQYWYYILEMSFYGCLFFSIASDVKRKDFREQIIHHVATLVLLSFSWCANFIRSAKMFNYAGWEKTSKALFVAFAVIFMVTRLVIFPFWIIHCTWVYPLHHYPAFFGYYFFNAMLVVLLCLHLFWSSLILRMIRKFMFGTVHALFQHSSLGVSLNIKVTKLVLLHTRPDTLEVSHHGERSLRSFCHWQHSEFGGRRRLGAEMSADSPTVDSAVFVTRTDFCVHKDEPCDTVGIAYLGGACSSRRKCALVEDNGLNLALTIAHELGHNLGMSHDEDHTNCTSQSHIMSGEWVKGRKPSDMSWSSCSRKDLEAFLRSKASDCLLQTDPRSQSQVRLGSKLPGMNHSVNEQCRILFGLNATFCKEMEELMCAGLWCLTAGDEFCKTKLDAPLEGTECGTNKWCRAGECVSKTYLPQHEDGDWSLWSPWSICSRTCGTGVRFRQRKCDNPPPSPHGQPCPHASVEHGVCDGPPCPKGPLSFRDLQCRRSGTSGDMLMAVINDDKPCVLFCSSLGRGPPVLVADRVIDGTPCGPFESDLCVNGRCQKMGCDGVFGSSAQEDSCGVCDGKGHTCEVIRGDFQHTKGIGYVEAVVIPAGAWRIRVVEDKPSQSFLAVKDSRQNSINSNWKIELPGDFELAGTVVRYVRRGHWEKMSIKGPTKTPLHLMMLLFHNHSSALHYEYTMSLNTTHDQSREEQTEPEQLFIWTHSTWQDCSVQCGGGEKKTVVSCLRMVKQSVEIVNDSFCQPENRPLPKTLPCNSQPCHYRWTAGHWGGCSARCGPGVQQREVSCVQELQNGSLIPTKNRFCSGEKPSPLQDCEGTLCRMMWTASEWSECSSACGSGVQRRKVLCANPQGPCEPQSRPTEEEPCSNHSECYHWKFGEWSKCSSSCGRGLQSRVIQCMHIVTGHHGDSCPVVLRPPTYRKCYQDPCPEEISTNSVSSRRPG